MEQDKIFLESSWSWLVGWCGLQHEGCLTSAGSSARHQTRQLLSPPSPPPPSPPPTPPSPPPSPPPPSPCSPILSPLLSHGWLCADASKFDSCGKWRAQPLVARSFPTRRTSLRFVQHWQRTALTGNLPTTDLLIIKGYILLKKYFS